MMRSGRSLVWVHGCLVLAFALAFPVWAGAAATCLLVGSIGFFWYSKSRWINRAGSEDTRGECPTPCPTSHEGVHPDASIPASVTASATIEPVQPGAIETVEGSDSQDYDQRASAPSVSPVADNPLAQLRDNRVYSVDDRYAVVRLVLTIEGARTEAGDLLCEEVALQEGWRHRLWTELLPSTCQVLSATQRTRSVMPSTAYTTPQLGTTGESSTYGTPTGNVAGGACDAAPHAADQPGPQTAGTTRTGLAPCCLSTAQPADPNSAPPGAYVPQPDCTPADAEGSVCVLLDVLFTLDIDSAAEGGPDAEGLRSTLLARLDNGSTSLPARVMSVLLGCEAEDEDDGITVTVQAEDLLLLRYVYFAGADTWLPLGNPLAPLPDPDAPAPVPMSLPSGSGSTCSSATPLLEGTCRVVVEPGIVTLGSCFCLDPLADLLGDELPAGVSRSGSLGHPSPTCALPTGHSVPSRAVSWGRAPEPAAAAAAAVTAGGMQAVGGGQGPEDWSLHETCPCVCAQGVGAATCGCSRDLTVTVQEFATPGAPWGATPAGSSRPVSGLTVAGSSEGVVEHMVEDLVLHVHVLCTTCAFGFPHGRPLGDAPVDMCPCRRPGVRDSLRARVVRQPVRERAPPRAQGEAGDGEEEEEEDDGSSEEGGEEGGVHGEEEHGMLVDREAVGAAVRGETRKAPEHHAMLPAAPLAPTYTAVVRVSVPPAGPAGPPYPAGSQTGSGPMPADPLAAPPFWTAAAGGGASGVLPQAVPEPVPAAGLLLVEAWRGGRLCGVGHAVLVQLPPQGLTPTPRPSLAGMDVSEPLRGKARISNWALEAASLAASLAPKPQPGPNTHATHPHKHGGAKQRDARGKRARRRTRRPLQGAARSALRRTSLASDSGSGSELLHGGEHSALVFPQLPLQPTRPAEEPRSLLLQDLGLFLVYAHAHTADTLAPAFAGLPLRSRLAVHKALVRSGLRVLDAAVEARCVGLAAELGLRLQALGCSDKERLLGGVARPAGLPLLHLALLSGSKDMALLVVGWCREAPQFSDSWTRSVHVVMPTPCTTPTPTTATASPSPSWLGAPHAPAAHSPLQPVRTVPASLDSPIAARSSSPLAAHPSAVSQEGHLPEASPGMYQSVEVDPLKLAEAMGLRSVVEQLTARARAPRPASVGAVLGVAPLPVAAGAAWGYPYQPYQ